MLAALNEVRRGGPARDRWGSPPPAGFAADWSAFNFEGTEEDDFALGSRGFVEDEADGMAGGCKFYVGVTNNPAQRHMQHKGNSRFPGSGFIERLRHRGWELAERRDAPVSDADVRLEHVARRRHPGAAHYQIVLGHVASAFPLRARAYAV